MQQQSLPKGFISVNEAINLINKDTRTAATVDTAFLLRNLPYLRVDGNYTIKKQKHVNGRVVDNGEVFVHISNDYELATLKHTITEHYKKASGKEIDADTIGLRSMTTTVDDQENPSGRVARNKKPMTKAGDDIISGVSKNVEE